VEGGDSWAAFKLDKADLWLLLSGGSAGAGCCPADSASVEALKNGAPSRAPLVETLKSRCVKGQILSARQVNFDRVLELEVVRFVAAGFGVKYYLVLEATEPVGNLLLLNEERRIEEAARHASPDLNHYRTILPGHLYVPPPAFEGLLPSELDQLDCESLFQVRGVGRPLARMIASDWERRDPPEWLRMLRSVYEEEVLPCQRTPKGYLTRFPVSLQESEQLGNDAFHAAASGVLRPLLSLSRSRLMRELDARVARAVKARERHLDGLLKQLENSAGAEFYRRKGELLLANLGTVPPRADTVTLREWGGEETVEIALDPKLSPVRNAERYFKKYKKARVDPQKIQEEAAFLRSAIEELKEQRDLLDSIEDPAKLEEAVRDVMDWLAPADKEAGKKAKKKRPDPPHARFEIGGYTVLVGLSARGNRFVTFKQATGDDLWLHAHEIPGAHVVIKGARGRGELENSETLLFAASLAAAHSRGKGSLSVQVDYTERRHVRSVPGPAVALVTYVQPGTLRADPRRWKEIMAAKAESE
jgi:predicted ribosome quality control (RQC) complex YloA/Tae2 family protein